MWFTWELYSLKLDTIEILSEFLTHIKLFEKQIDVIKIKFTKNKQTLLTLTMTLVTDDYYCSFVQIWQTISNMIAECAQQMLLEEEQI